MMLRLAAEYDKLGDRAAERATRTFRGLLRPIGREMLLISLYLRSYL